MKWSEFFTSSIGKKLVMALTGIFLITFLVIHAGVNACIFKDFFVPEDNGDMFNRAADFMGRMVVVRIMEWVLFLGFFIHIIQGFMLEFQNRSKRSVGYAVKMGSKGSKWYSRSMGLLGTILLIFLLLHWWHFWVPSRFTGAGIEEADMSNHRTAHNMFLLMKVTFQETWIVVLYVLACISLAWHLLHGFQSSFRTLGLSNHRYIGLINAIGIGYSILIPLIFALMPISMYFGWIG